MGHRLFSQKNAVVTTDNPNKEDNYNIIKNYLSLFPSYAELFNQTQTMLLEGNGPLAVHERHFIAVMACKVSGCEPLVNQQEALFLSVGGSPAWLDSAVPVRLARLSTTNRLLYRAPHLLTVHHIKNLTVGEGCFTLAEVVQAIVTLAIFHSLSTFIGGCMASKSLTDSSNDIDGRSIGLLDIFHETFILKEWKNFGKDLKRKRSFSEGEVPKPKDSNINKILNTGAVNSNCDTSNNNNIPTDAIRVQDYSWDDHGFSILSNFYSEIAILLDEKFRISKTIYKKVENTSNSGVKSTVMFQRAIWTYVQHIHGVDHDDYNYGDIKEHIGEDIMEFVSICCLQPDGDPFAINGLKISHSQKVHISILMMEAKLQSNLLYSLRAVMKYMK